MRFLLCFVILTLSSALCFAAMGEAEVLALQAEWANLQYNTQDHAAQEAGFAQLAAKAQALGARNPGAAEPLIWQGIALASQAQQHNDTGGIRLAEQGRDALLKALAVNSTALKGAAYVTLGALYYKVPGWPLGFGDTAKAREYLKQALTANPDSIDAHYFYGDYLYQKKLYAEAAEELQKAVDAPKQPGSAVADQGRREDAGRMLAKIKRRR